MILDESNAKVTLYMAKESSSMCKGALIMGEGTLSNGKGAWIMGEEAEGMDGRGSLG